MKEEKMDEEKEGYKIKINLKVERSFGDHEHIDPLTKGILKTLIPLIIVGAIVLISFLQFGIYFIL
jgi:hypothetical protein